MRVLPAPSTHGLGRPAYAAGCANLGAGRAVVCSFFSAPREDEAAASAAKTAGDGPNTAECVPARARVGRHEYVLRFWGSRDGEMRGGMGRYSASREDPASSDLEYAHPVGRNVTTAA